MSYLDVPRIHFAGEFRSDPSTANNTLGICCLPGAERPDGSPRPASECAHNPTVTIDGNPDLELWNKDGTHQFQFRNCTVRRGLDSSGNIRNQTAQDTLIGGRVLTTDDLRPGRAVDLDPSYPPASQIWGVEIKVEDRAGSEFVVGKLKTATLRQLWDGRAPGGFASGFGGVFQSVLTNLRWNPDVGPFQSALLSDLRQASPTQLTIKLVAYAYDATPGSSNFRIGKVLGTVGPVSAGEPEHFLEGRMLVNSAPSPPPFGEAPFKVNSARKRLVVDLGNAMPESAPGGNRRAQGTLQAQIDMATPAAAVTLGTLDYDRAHYEETAGIEELQLTQAQITQLDSRPLRIRATSPARVILKERSTGVHVDASGIAIRLNPGEQQEIEFLATQFGRRAASVDIALSLVNGVAPTGLSLSHLETGVTTMLALPGPSTVRTSTNGTATVRFSASDPGHPRPHIDGQVFLIGFYIGPGGPANLRGVIAVLVFNKHPVPTNPRWSDTRPILTQYYRLFPSMRFINLSDHAIVKGSRTQIAAALRRAETDPTYMPVTRDLSRDKKTLLLRWLDNGAPM